MMNMGHNFMEVTKDNLETDPYQVLKRQVEHLWQHEREMEAARLHNMLSPA